MRHSSPPLWDLPTRLFHWLIVCCLPLAWWSGETDNYAIHQWVGYTVTVLVVSRVAWGVLGSRHSRFTDFVVGPAKVLAYIRGQGADSAGHNPLGGWSVLALLLLLLTQAVSGLFNSDDVLFSGRFIMRPAPVSGHHGQVHEIAFYVLLALVGLHIQRCCITSCALQGTRAAAGDAQGGAPGREGRRRRLPGGGLWRLYWSLPWACGGGWSKRRNPCPWCGERVTAKTRLKARLYTPA